MTDTLERREQAADRLRDGLMLALRELDRRRHAALDVRRMVLGHRTLLLGAGGVALALGGTVLVLRLKHKRRLPSPARAGGVRRVRGRPEQVALYPVERTLLQELMRRTVLLVATTVITRLVKGASARYWPQRERTAIPPARPAEARERAVH